MSQQSLVILVFMVFLLGLRHGFDLDHLATIDSMTRAVKSQVRLSKCVGLLFSLGHGLVVILMTVIVGSGFIRVTSPAWLEVIGAWISIIFLIVFGLLTFWNILPHSHPLPTGIRQVLFKKLTRETYHPIVIILIGALFAISFDTFSQVALFSISASVMAGYFFSIVLGIIFMLGMMASDGMNGFFVSSLIHLADRRSLMVSRGIGFVIACFSLGLGLIGVLNHLQFKLL